MTPEVPDILQPNPAVRVDLVRIKRALLFAFAGGGSDETLHQCLDEATVAPTSWNAEHFSEDLFVSTFIEESLRVKIDGHHYKPSTRHLTRLLTSPPEDLRTVEFRQKILTELADSSRLRSEFEAVYSSIHRLRSSLSDVGGGPRHEIIQRRVDILRGTRELIETLSSSLEVARSGLARLNEFGNRLLASEGYRHLCQLLDFESNTATLETRLKVGFDGSLRQFEIVRIADAKPNAFYASPIGRFCRKLVQFFRGYGFTDAEVLGRLVDEIFAPFEDELPMLFQLVGDFEFYLAALNFRDRAEAAGLPVCLAEFAIPSSGVDCCERDIVDLYNPLLLTDSKRPIPCTIAQKDHGRAVLITGPNSGGKTRLLQSFGLAQLLGQCGFFVPARRARLVWSRGMFLSLIEHTKAHQTEGHLGMELLRIRSLFESIRPGSLVILDELCSGTNPSEGEEICELVLTLLQEVRPQAFVTTHFLKFAERLAEERGGDMEFLQVELDARDNPTYQFVPGVATTSLARKTAERLGVTREDLRELIDRQANAAD